MRDKGLRVLFWCYHKEGGGRGNHSFPLKMHVDVMVQFMNSQLHIFGLNILIFSFSLGLGVLMSVN